MPYQITVAWSEEDEAFVALVPALPGCAAHGDTADEARRAATEAALGIMEAMREHGRPLPPAERRVG
jgi:predicted RNase H-like HicB family nuclease